MYISPLNSYKPNFRGNNRIVRDNINNKVYKTTTYFFREDLDWNSFVNYIAEKYKDTNKVHIINHACSNGQEPCSLVIKLLENLGEKAKKFLPIIAKDFDKDNIAGAQFGKCGISDIDLYRIKSHMQCSLDSYFIPTRPSNPVYSLALIPKDAVKKHILYSQGDVLEDVQRIPGKNTIFLCRNIWPYLTPSEREHLAKTLGEKMDSTALLVTGDFDEESCQLGDLLHKYKFEETPVKYVYSKQKY